MLKTIKQSLLYLIAFSSFFLLAETVNANDYHPINKTTYGFLTNNATIHQEPNDSSQELGKIQVNIWDNNNGNNNEQYSHTNIPMIATTDVNDMYKITYHNIAGYIDQNSFTTKSNYDLKQNFTNFTRNNMINMVNNNNEHKYQVPNFKGMKIQDIPSAKGNTKQSFNNGKVYYNRTTGTRGIRSSNQLDVWDSWPLQNKDGTLADYHGYHVVLALAGNYNQFKKGQEGITYAPEARIYVFYQKIGAKNTGTSSWKNAGPAFVSNMDGTSKNDQYLKHQTQEWSGSAYLDDDNSVRLFYTDFSGDPRINGNGNNNQVLSTAKLFLNVNNNGLSVDRSKTTNHCSLSN